MEERRLEIHPHMLVEIKSHREKDYAHAAVSGQHMQLGFLKHSLMISRLHFMLEMACRNSGGRIQLASWSQGSQPAGRKAEVPKVKASMERGQTFWQETAETERLPVEPDAMFTLRLEDGHGGQRQAHFFYEADRGTMTTTDMLKKFRAYYSFIKRQQHKEAFGVHPIRAVLVETPDEARGNEVLLFCVVPQEVGAG